MIESFYDEFINAFSKYAQFKSVTDECLTFFNVVENSVMNKSIKKDAELIDAYNFVLEQKCSELILDAHFLTDEEESILYSIANDTFYIVKTTLEQSGYYFCDTGCYDFNGALSNYDYFVDDNGNYCVDWGVKRFVLKKLNAEDKSITMLKADEY